MADELFGFNRDDADAILSGLNQQGGEGVTENRRPPVTLLLGKTKTGGLPGNGTGFVYYMQPTATGWAVTTTEYPVFNRGGAIAADKDVLLIPVNGRWLSLEIC